MRTERNLYRLVECSASWVLVAAAAAIGCGDVEPGAPNSNAATSSASSSGAATGSGASTGTSGTSATMGSTGSTGTGTTAANGATSGTSGSTGAGGATGTAGAGGPTGSSGSGSSGSGGAGAGGSASADGGPSIDASSDVRAAQPDASSLPRGPFTCTELIGLFSTGEWWDAGFYNGLGADLKPKWQGRFSHYGYTYEYANPDSYVWSPVNVGGTNNVRLTAPCAQNGSAPDRIVYQAWTWELTTEAAWMQSLEASIATIRAKRPSAKRIDVMTIIRCPMNLWCRADKPPLGPNTDRDATKQDCHVPDYVDSAFAKVAAAHPDLVGVVPPFEAHACAMMIDGIHLHEQTGPVAADIAAYFKTMP